MKLSVGGDDSVQNEFGQLLSNFRKHKSITESKKKAIFLEMDIWKVPEGNGNNSHGCSNGLSSEPQ